jgi:hypothetical protein
VDGAQLTSIIEQLEVQKESLYIDVTKLSLEPSEVTEQKSESIVLARLHEMPAEPTP